MKIRQPPPPTTTIVSILTSSTIASTTTTVSTALSTASSTTPSTATAIVSTGLSLKKGVQFLKMQKVRVWTEKTESSSCFKKRDLTFHLELICESPETVKNRVSRSRNRDRDVDFDFGEKEDVEIQGERRRLQNEKGVQFRISISGSRRCRGRKKLGFIRNSDRFCEDKGRDKVIRNVLFFFTKGKKIISVWLVGLANESHPLYLS
ncbi:hypothetical protein DY000_02063955 [Brassica cretica]|uniref:Uncharacterized protein n=1 Tax=Brassica cretica TaxID=69181 RepID=A0ABQ7AZ07_BRACR|nr:hypothetical protein DY000_02063955 [Brassica cretica]